MNLDALLLLAVILGVLAFAGWVLGIVGFFRAGAARREAEALRMALARLTAAQRAAAGAVPPQASPSPTSHQPTSLPWAAPVVPPTPMPSATPPGKQAAGLQGPEPPAIPVAQEPARQDAVPAYRLPQYPTPEPAADPVAHDPTRDLETLLTTRWGVWIGSAALLLAGIFLVRYAVEQALLGPAARCALAALLGFALLVAAEWLQRHDAPPLPGPLRTDQAPAGLAAGGTAILFGAAYGAGPFYELLPPLLAFAAMAAASLVGLAASLRYGPLTAAIGVAGAFATPALVATEAPSLPGLFAYLLVVSAAALLVVRRTAWTWLSWATTIAGAVWVCLAAFPQAPDRWAAAAFVPAAALLHLVLLPTAAFDHPIGRRLSWMPFAALGTAGLLLESLVPGTAPRLALFLLSPIAVWKGMAEPRLDRLPWLAALFGLFTLLLWALPDWTPSGEVMRIEGVVQAVLPGDWAPQVIRPLLTAAALFAAFHAATGLWLERRAPRPLHWAALVGAVPVLTLAVACAQVARFQADIAWATGGLALAAALTATATLAIRAQAKPRAGIHAAGAVAALALACAMLLHNQWLTLAVALFLPALAWIEAQADLPPLRRVALAVAVVVMIRLMLNWYVLGYAFGETPLVNGLLATYAAPAVAFAYAAWLFRRRADDLPVATLEAGAVAFAGCFVALEIRHWFGEGDIEGDVTFDESALHLLTVGIQAAGYLVLAQRTGRSILHWAWRILGSLALGGGVLLLLLNPAVTGAEAGIFSLAAAYLVPAVLAMAARRRIARADLGRLLALYAVVAGFAWITLQVRQVFHPDALGLADAPIEDAELWAWSGMWLVYGIGLMVQGIRSGERLLRLIALGVVGLVCVKVFLVDMSDLTGLWRVLSFLGLGLTLIGLGAVHRRLVLPQGRFRPPA